MGGKRVTIKEVAAEANVTAQTVSRVFGGKGYVAAETRKKVLAAARELNYIPNRVAAALRTGESKNIAVVFDSLCNIYFSIMVDYIHREVQKHGYMLQTIFVNSHTITEDIYCHALSMGASAVISFLENDPGLDKVISKFNVPLIIVGRRSVGSQIDYITTDDVNGGRIAANRLIEGGCKTFLYASEAFEMTCVKDRFSGFSEVLAKHGYTSDILDCSSGAEKTVTEYINSGKIPDGIFCLSDVIGYSVLKALKNLGLSHIKVIGYDDIQSDITMPVNLTSVGLNKYEHVVFLVTKIIDKIEGRLSGRIAVKVPVKLNVGVTG